ncbi:RNA polymerase sigma factor [Kutzneria sp. CA-103260]|nr:RNA polymerase sigma factor [Kutzneria sp. CA-103260]
MRGTSLTADDRADVSQEVWLKAYLHLESVVDPHCVPGWLKVITRREMIKYAARSQRLVPCGDPSAVDDVSPERPIDEAVIAILDGENLHNAIGYLRERERDLIMLLLSEPPLSYDEIGNRLDMPRGSIGPSRERCLAHLRAILAG